MIDLKFIQKHKYHILTIGAVCMLTLISEVVRNSSQESVQVSSVDMLIPDNFVLVSIKLSNSSDILPLIKEYGVVDIYSYSEDKLGYQVAQELKVIPTNKEEGFFAAITPENQASYLLEYTGPFYAVVKNPKKQNSQIFKKKVNSSFQIIEVN